MPGRKTSNRQGGNLRKKAEGILVKHPEAVERVPPGKKMSDLIHELDVHQVELGLQNEELRKSQVDLAQARDKYFRLYDLAPTAYFTLDAQGMIQEMNFAGAELLGRERAPLQKRPFSNWVRKEDLEIFYAHLRQVRETGRRQACQLCFLAGSGEEVCVHMVTLPLVEEEEAGPRFLSSLTDISEEKRSKEKLEQALVAQEGSLRQLEAEKLKLETVMANTPVPIVVVDGKCSITFANSASEELYGRTLPRGDSLDCLADFQFRRPDGRPLAREENPLIRAATSGETYRDVELVLTGPDNRSRYVLVNARPMKDAQGRVLGAVGTFRDITALKVQQEALRAAQEELEARVRERTADLQEATERLEQINRELQEFAFVASHDLQEPLRKILAFGQLLEEESGGMIGEQAHDYLMRIRNSAGRMQSLIDALLAYYQMSSKTQAFTRVDLNEVVREALSNLEYRVRQTGAQVEVAELPSLQASPVLMLQLFQNVIANALKFHRDGDRPRVNLSSRTSGDRVEISVEDNGIGFEEKYADRIFNLFLKLHGKSRYEGAGMGLAICRKIVEVHRGTITARGVPEKGATFTISLPLRQKRESERGTGNSERGTKSNGTKTNGATNGL
ncbi:MAG: ATP-binding protein [Thermodesulfobacteriota bacterium]